MTEAPQSASAASGPPQDTWATNAWARIARRIRVPLSFLVAVLFVWLARPTRSSLIVGFLVMVPGLIVRALASGHVKKNERLTTSGPYAYTRNPLYLGSLILAAGFAVAARSWWIVAVMALLFAFIYIPIIVGEERYLRQAFPTYEEYARHVPRLLPRLTPYGTEQGSFSSELFWKHREYQASLGCVVVLAILIAKMLL